MTLDLDELERLRAEATAGRWEYSTNELDEHEIIRTDTWGTVLVGDGFGGNGINVANDLRLTAAAVNALPELIRAAREAERLRASLGRIAAAAVPVQEYDTPGNMDAAAAQELGRVIAVELAGQQDAPALISAARERDRLRALCLRLHRYVDRLGTDEGTEGVVEEWEGIEGELRGEGVL